MHRAVREAIDEIHVGSIELMLQVALDCKERGTLLAAVWAHCMALVELRCNLVSRQAIAQQEGVSAALRQEAFAAATAVKCVAMLCEGTPTNRTFLSHPSC